MKSNTFFASLVAFGFAALSFSCQKIDPPVVDSGKEGTITWELTNKGKLTIGGDGEMPDCVPGSPPWTWAYGSDFIKAVVIGNGITFITDFAFANCVNLNSVTIPKSVTRIGRSTFFNCFRLNPITIPQSVINIGSNAFSGCRKLTSVTIGDDVISVGYGALEGCYNLTSVSIGNGVTSIEYGTFKNCHNLVSVSIGNAVTSIHHQAFRECKGLTSITCRALEPPVFIVEREEYREYWGWRSVDKSVCVLYVPAESIEKYRAAPEWSKFEQIKAINDAQ